MFKLIDNYDGTILFVGDYQDCLEQYNNFYEDHPHAEDIYIDDEHDKDKRKEVN